MSKGGSGFTLAETVMAVSVTLIIGLAVAGVAAALSNVQANSEEYYEHLHSGRAAVNRLQATLRKARLVTAIADDKLVIWARDVRDPGQINVSELVGVHVDSETNRLIERSVVFPSTMSDELRDALDVVLPLSAVMDAGLAEGPIGGLNQYEVARVLAYNVQRFRVYPDTSAPLIRTVKLSVTVGSESHEVQLSGGATLRAVRVADVGQNVDGFFLSPPAVP